MSFMSSDYYNFKIPKKMNTQWCENFILTEIRIPSQFACGVFLARLCYDVCDSIDDINAKLFQLSLSHGRRRPGYDRGQLHVAYTSCWGGGFRK